MNVVSRLLSEVAFSAILSSSSLSSSLSAILTLVQFHSTEHTLNTFPVPNCVRCAVGNTQLSLRSVLAFRGLAC